MAQDPRRPFDVFSGNCPSREVLRRDRKRRGDDLRGAPEDDALVHVREPGLDDDAVLHGALAELVA